MDELSEIILKLERMELISVYDGKIKVLKKNLHLPKGSKLEFPHQLIMRHRSIHHLTSIKKSKKTSFSATFSTNEKAFIKMQERFGIFLEEIQKISSSEGKSTGCYQFNFDLFPWTKN